MNDYDAIVIGAGNAGLTAAATLQRSGARTLLIERHNVPGGCGTSFRRGRFEFEVALHQLSGVGVEGQPMTLRNKLFEQLGIADKLDFVAEDDLYRAVIPGQVDLVLPADWDGAIDAVEASFPGNAARTREFFDLVKKITFWQVAAMRGMPVDQLDPMLFKYGLRTVQQVLDEFFDDDRLKYALGIYWTYLGQPPSNLAFQDLAITLFAYFEYKPFHVRGGSQAMSTAILDSFLQAGGDVRFNTEVRSILTEDGRVLGVHLDDGTDVIAPDVVSNASLPITYGMLDGVDVPAEISSDLATRRIGVSGFVLHMGLDASPAELGFTTSTSFISADADADRAYASSKSLSAPARFVCVSAYDVAPIGFSPTGATHISLMTLQYADPWYKVAPEDYARTKFAYAESLIDMCETLTPGLRDAIEEVDVATPLTMMRYLGHPGGAIYGYDQEIAEGWLFRNSERETHLPGLHLAGSWAGVGGFQPTLEAGARVARRLLRRKAA
ncbi:phytoene desaturase family protein [Nocardia sp. NPDC055049]